MTTRIALHFQLIMAKTLNFRALTFGCFTLIFLEDLIPKGETSLTAALQIRSGIHALVTAGIIY